MPPRKRREVSPDRTIKLKIRGVEMELTASEGVLQRLAALLQFGAAEDSAMNEEFQKALDGPLVFDEAPAPPAPPEKTDDELRDDIRARLKKIIEKSGAALAQEYLAAGGASKVSELDRSGLEKVLHLLKKAKTD